MKLVTAALLIVAGAWLFVTGYNRKNSLVGAAADFGTRVANSFDGKSRSPQHTAYMVGGGILVVVGLGVAFTGMRKP